MTPTPYPDINAHLDWLLRRMQAILGSNLVGLYIYGSLVTGDFDYAISDLDLAAALARELDGAEFAALDRMHHEFLASEPAWDNRLEIVYLSVDSLQTFKEHEVLLAVISPGEPFHFKTTDVGWTMNWYVVREKGYTLFGPPPATVIAPISWDEYLNAVLTNTQAWREWVYRMDTRPSQGYAILTMCRALYAYERGELVSKRRAAEWAQGELPAWAPLIRDAWRWRAAFREQGIDPAVTMPQTVAFVHAVIDRIDAERARERTDK